MFRQSNSKSALMVLLVMTVMMLISCERIQIGEPFTCRTETRYYLEPGLSFTIDSVDDYRCPKDLICIWGGDVDLYFNIREHLTETDTVLRLSGGPYLFGNYSFEIMEVNPLRNHDQVVEQDDYRIKMLIQKD